MLREDDKGRKVIKAVYDRLKFILNKENQYTKFKLNLRIIDTIILNNSTVINKSASCKELLKCINKEIENSTDIYKIALFNYTIQKVMI